MRGRWRIPASRRRPVLDCIRTLADGPHQSQRDDSGDVTGPTDGATAPPPLLCGPAGITAAIISPSNYVNTNVVRG